MFLDPVTQMLPFLALSALSVATLGIALGALRSARRSEQLGEDRFELLRDHGERLELLREERRALTEELELERQERLEAQRRVKQLTREHPHLKLERELQRVTEELELEREGRLHNHRERPALGIGAGGRAPRSLRRSARGRTPAARGAGVGRGAGGAVGGTPTNFYGLQGSVGEPVRRQQPLLGHSLRGS
jgi:hypothetical protein